MNEQAKMMRRIGMKISICMGVSLSFFLSLTGIATSGHFSLHAWIRSFVISALISLIISFLVPMKKVNDKIIEKYGLQPGAVSTRCITSLISDLIYTPVITLCMIYLAYKSATAYGAQLHFLPMYLSSLIMCFVIGFILIFILEPVFIKMFVKRP